VNEEDAVRLVVHRHLTEVRSCFEHLGAPASAGVIEVSFTLELDGSATSAHPISNTTGSEELAACVARAVESWRFPAPQEGPIDYVYPFRFARPGP
jgi:TonB family protein